MGAAALDEATEGDVASANKAARTSVGHVVTVRSGGRGEARPAVADVAMRRLLGSPPLRTSPRGMPWGMLPRTRLPGGGEGAGRRDEAARGERKGGAAAADETTGWLRGDVSSVDEASRMTVWRTVTDEAAKRGSVGRRFRRSHRTAAVIIASAEKCGRPREMLLPTRPWGESGAEAETTVPNEVTGLSQSASLLWTRSRPLKGGEQGPASQRRLWASRCGQVHGGGGGVWPAARMRPHNGRGSRLALWMWPRRKAARMLCGCCYAGRL